MPIPEQYKKFCENGEDVIECAYILHRDCPNTCKYSREIAGVNQFLKIRIKTGIERFLERYPDWLGVGGIINVPDEIKGEFER